MQTPSEPLLGWQWALRAGLTLGRTGAFILLHRCPCPPLTQTQGRVRPWAQPSCKLTLLQTTPTSCLGFSPHFLSSAPHLGRRYLCTFAWALGGPGRTLRTVSSQIPGFYTIRGSAKYVTSWSSQSSLNTLMVQRDPYPHSLEEVTVAHGSGTHRRDKAEPGFMPRSV